jgi:catechol 2,3-dioxygenase-like lactoylglutathione lyase family enzyme
MKVSLLDYVVLVVENIDRSLAFYCGVLGLELGHRSGAFAQLRTGTTRLALFERSAMAETLGKEIGAPSPDSPGFEIGFKVANVDQAYGAFVKQGAAAVMAPTTRAWGQRTAYLRDPDGHLVELAEDLREDRNLP